MFERKEVAFNQRATESRRGWMGLSAKILLRLAVLVRAARRR